MPKHVAINASLDKLIRRLAIYEAVLWNERQILRRMHAELEEQDAIVRHSQWRYDQTRKLIIKKAQAMFRQDGTTQPHPEVSVSQAQHSPAPIHVAITANIEKYLPDGAERRRND